MRNRTVILLLTYAFLSFECVAFGQNSQDQNSQGGDSQGQNSQGDQEKPVPGAEVFWAKGQRPAKAQYSSSSSTNLRWWGGNIMPTVQTQAIFWGPNWSDATFTGDKITGLDTFYSGMVSSGYAKTADEYYDSSNQYVTADIKYSGHKVDSLSTAANGSQKTPILNEVCKVIPAPVENGYYPVYVDRPRGRAGYCAWHSAGDCNGTPVQFAFFFNLDDDAGCDPQDTKSGHSQGLAALANVSGHEISEARTDPRLNAWYDRFGNENADKCAWSFGTDLLSFTNGSQWKIQGNWSNRAYNAQTGHPNLHGQKGCIDGGNYK